MKINYICDLCSFLYTHELCSGKCGDCTLVYGGEVQGELTVPHKCICEWEYYTDDDGFNNKILRKCITPGGCGLHAVKWFKEIKRGKLSALFEDEKEEDVSTWK